MKHMYSYNGALQPLVFRNLGRAVGVRGAFHLTVVRCPECGYKHDMASNARNILYCPWCGYEIHKDMRKYLPLGGPSGIEPDGSFRFGSNIDFH